MQAAILAGGMGTRLRPVTEQIPKVMVPVNGKPFLLHLLELLRNQGIDDVVLCIGYLGERVRDFFGNGQDLGIRIQYSQEKEKLLGTGGALKQAQNLLDDRFFVLNGDVYLPVDYTELERASLQRAKKAFMVVYGNQEYTGQKNNVELDDDLMVVRHDKESHDSSLKYVDTGVLVFRREVLDIMERGCSVSLEKGLYPTLIPRRELAAHVTQQRFYEMGTPEQQRDCEQFLKWGGR